MNIFKGLVGQQVLKQDGSIMAKYAKLLPDFPCGPALHVHRMSSEYSLTWIVRASEVCGGCSEYYETWVNVGQVSKGILTKVENVSTDRRTTYAETEVLLLRDTAKRTKEIYEAARDACSPFGE